MKLKRKKRESKKKIKPTAPAPSTRRIISEAAVNNIHPESADDIDKNKIKEGMNEKKGIRWSWDKLIDLLQLLCTFGLFFYAIQQNNASQRSADAAIDAVKEVRNQFEIENRPYLVVLQIDSMFFGPNYPIKLIYGITNIGKHPEKLTGARYAFMYVDKIETPFKEIEMQLTNNIEKEPISVIEAYVGTQSPHTIITDSKNSITKDAYDAVMRRTAKMYWMGEYFYSNLTNESNGRKMKIILEIAPPLADMKKIDNTDIR